MYDEDVAYEPPHMAKKTGRRKERSKNIMEKTHAGPRLFAELRASLHRL